MLVLVKVRRITIMQILFLFKSYIQHHIIIVVGPQQQGIWVCKGKERRTRVRASLWYTQCQSSQNFHSLLKIMLKINLCQLMMRSTLNSGIDIGQKISVKIFTSQSEFLHQFRHWSHFLFCFSSNFSKPIKVWPTQIIELYKVLYQTIKKKLIICIIHIPEVMQVMSSTLRTNEMC